MSDWLPFNWFWGHLYQYKTICTKQKKRVRLYEKYYLTGIQVFLCSTRRSKEIRFEDNLAVKADDPCADSFNNGIVSSSATHVQARRKV